MSFVNQLPTERASVVGVINPSSQSAGAATTGWVDAAKFRRFMGIVTCGVLGSSATVDAKLQQATSSTGSGAKDVPNSSITQLVKASNDNSVAIINSDTANLDAANNFRYVRLSVTVGTAASLTAGHLLGFDPFDGPADLTKASAVAQTVNA